MNWLHATISTALNRTVAIREKGRSHRLRDLILVTVKCGIVVSYLWHGVTDHSRGA